MLVPRSYPDFHEKMKGLKPRENDIWVASYPKSGTTWTQVLFFHTKVGLFFDKTKITTPFGSFSITHIEITIRNC